MSSQETRGKMKEPKGRVKETAGIITGDRELDHAGSRERAKGAVHETIGRAHRKVGEALEGLANAINKQVSPVRRRNLRFAENISSVSIRSGRRERIP